MPKAPTINIQPLDLQLMQFTIMGITPLIMHKWSEKARKMMLDKQTGKGTTKKKPPKDPVEDYLQCIYWLDKEKEQAGYPCIAAKAAMINACRFVEGLPMTVARGALQVGSTFEKTELFAIYGEHGLREDFTRNQTGVADIRHRAQFDEWSGQFLVRFNAGVLTAEQVASLLQVAGVSAGLGDWRPETGGDFGQFRITNIAHIKRQVIEPIPEIQEVQEAA